MKSFSTPLVQQSNQEFSDFKFTASTIINRLGLLMGLVFLGTSLYAQQGNLPVANSAGSNSNVVASEELQARVNKT